MPGSYQDITRFIITTDDGVRYTYGLPSLARYVSVLEAIPIYYPNAWRLLAIVTPDYDGDIEAILQDGGNQTPYDKIGWIKFEYAFDASSVYSSLPVGKQLIQNTYLKKIITPTHTAEFFTANREDVDLVLNAYNGGTDVSSAYKKLTSIELRTNSTPALLVKRIELAQRYSLAKWPGNNQNKGKLTLDRIKFFDYSNTELPGYEFQYDTLSTQRNPAWMNLPTFYHYDGFGYYETEGGTPIYDIDADTTDGQAWCLKKVIFPTGGWEEYEYQNDRIDDAFINLNIFVDNPQGTSYYNTHPFYFDDPLGLGSCQRQGGIRVSKIIRNDAMGGEPLEITYSYGPGHVPIMPPKLIPWFVRVRLPNIGYTYPEISENNFNAMNRGSMDVVYEWVRKTYPDQSRDSTRYHATSIQEHVLYYTYGGSLQWTLVSSNEAKFLGMPLSQFRIRDKLIDEEHYDYDFAFSRSGSIVFENLGNDPDRDMFLDQISPVLKIQSGISKRAEQPAVTQWQNIEYQHDPKTRQQTRVETETEKWESRTDITYAHQISDYGGEYYVSPPPSGFAEKMRYQNLFTPIAQSSTYYKDKKAATPQFLLHLSDIKTYKSDLTENDKAVWKVHKKYNLNTTPDLTQPPAFDNWLDNGAFDARWMRAYTVEEYRYGNGTKFRDGKGTLLEVFYGDNGHNLSNASQYNGLFHAYLTGIRLNNYLSREFDYDTRFLQVNALKDEAGNTQTFTYDNFGRLQSHKDANDSTIAEYNYYFSRLPGGAFNPANPNSIKTTLHYRSSPSIKTDSYEYYDGRAQKIQTLTRATDESNDYYSALDLDVAGRIEKEYKTYRKSYNPGNPPPPQYDPNFASLQGDKFTEYHYNSFLDEQLTRIDFPGPKSDENSTRRHYRFVSADQELPQLYTNSGIIWKRQAVIDENGNETAAFTDESGNKILERRYDGSSIVTKAVSAQCQAGDPGCDNGGVFDTKQFTITFPQTVPWQCVISGVNQYGNAWFKVYPAGQPSNPLVNINSSGSFNGELLLQPGNYEIKAWAWHTSSHGGSSQATGSVDYLSAANLLSTTHFDYDGAGNLIKVRPPNYFTLPPGSLADDWMITYQYNTLNQLAQKTSPDAGTARYKYDRNGNLRFSQDARQATISKVSFMQYDFNNRLTRRGEATANFNSLDPTAVPYSFESASANWIIVNQYDTYPSTGRDPWNQFSSGDYPPSSVLTHIKGRLVATAHKSNGAWQVTLYSYDKNGRVINKYILTSGLAKTTLAYSYNLQGLPLQTSVQTGSSAFYHFNAYNRLGQLMEVKTSQTGSQPSLRDLRYSYNPTGTVAEQKFVEYSANNYRLSLPFGYHIRDWLTAIGDIAGANQKFAALYTHLPNGNIQKAEFLNSALASEKRYRYEYSYDPLSRLLGADYAYYSGNWVSSNKYDVSGLGYDANGNILSLTRRKDNGDFIDHLGYSYNRNNRLQSVADAVAATAEDWDAEDCAFTYDANGNVISMTENGQPAISNIQYDYRNLPVSLVNRTGQTVNYRYNAGGQRIYKQVGSNPAEHYILDEDRVLGVFKGAGLLYWNIYGNDGVGGRLEYILPEEGAVGGGEAAGSTQKLFYLKDHLGSTRAVMNTLGAMVESYDYYPFGLKMPGRVYPLTPTVTKNLFTGKELDGETGWYDLGSRSLMSALGRFPSPDRFADKYLSWSPYHYVLNNPVRFTDISGDTVDVDPQLLEPVVYSKGEKKGQTKSLADMTPAERQRHFFQQWWAENQEMVNELFGIGGKYETTNIAFKLSGYSKKFLGITVRTPAFIGHTAWARQGTDEGYFYHGGNWFEGGKLFSDQPITPDFGIDELQVNVYFHPEYSRDYYYTPPHEWKHVLIIFDAVKRGVPVPGGLKQHEMINQGDVPKIK